jgi:LPXTG-motif cell wall-anchored protein
MKLTWTNTEWDNFSGVASQDNLLMLNAGDDFLNAGGIFGKKLEGTGEAIIDKKTYTGVNNSYDIIMRQDNINSKQSVDYLQTKLDGYKTIASNVLADRDKYSVTIAQAATNSQSASSRGAKNATLWTYDRLVEATQKVLDDAIAIAQAKAKAKEEADAKAQAKADADAKAKAEADAKAKIKDLNNQLLNAKTPEEKARIQAEIDALAGNVAKATGGSKLIVYAVAGLAIIGVAYMLLRRK